MTDNRTTELLPCPFCGGEAHTTETARYGTRYGVACFCGASVRFFDTEAEAIAAWNTRVGLGSEINGETSDGYHTFNELYHHRAVLFSVIVRDHRELAWKARKHHDGTMYESMFIVGIETPKGQATYHYDIDPYWGMFDCKEREFAPEWDGHTPDDAIARIAELGSERHVETCELEYIETYEYPDGEEDYLCKCSECGRTSWEPAYNLPKFCGGCGRTVKR